MVAEGRFELPTKGL